jgi:hypothetical protein
MTKKQRREIYFSAYCVLESGEWEYDGVYWLLWTINGYRERYYDYKWCHKVIEMYPEFIKQKPAGIEVGKLWFETDPYDKQSRQDALIEAIKLTYL